MLLFYVRHGEPIYEPDGLTPLGKRQAEAVAKRLALYGIDEIYASSTKRAQDTARPTGELTHKQITVLDWCNENIVFEELIVKKLDGTKDWLYRDKETCEKFVSTEITSLGEKWYTHKDFNGALFESGIKRIRRETFAFLKTLGYEYDEKARCYNAISPNEKRIALFAHEGFGMAFLSTVLNIPYPMFCTHFEIEHSGITVIRFEGEGKIIPKLLQHSNDSHLYKDGLPTYYNNEIHF
ncbi:MAG: histidine phosphatase family protein [Muribaculaceae bacterium]|nr:histidine phosphatase family protein [Muribaculaceae bacterium]